MACPQVEQLFAAKSGRAGILGDIRQIKDEKEEGLASVEKLFEARGNKSGVMADIRQIQVNVMWVLNLPILGGSTRVVKL